jgi:hypothetical protein
MAKSHILHCPCMSGVCSCARMVLNRFVTPSLLVGPNYHFLHLYQPFYSPYITEFENTGCTSKCNLKLELSRCSNLRTAFISMLFGVFDAAASSVNMMWCTQVRKSLEEGAVPRDRFIITKQLTKRPEDYPAKEAQIQPHVVVALRRKAAHMRGAVMQASCTSSSSSAFMSASAVIHS